MNIYIPIEIKARELEGRFLISAVAAERGHTVILGSKSDTRNLCKKKVLPPGIIHDKSLTPSNDSLKYFEQVVNDGYVLTSQDEEAGVTLENYTEFAKTRYNHESVSFASKIFCWGRHDSETLKKFYNENAHKFVDVGSPRVDYWREEFKLYFNKFNVHKYFKDGPYILIPTNFPILLGKDKIWNIFARQRRAGYFSRDLDREFKLHNTISYNYRLIGEFVKLIRFLSEEFPELSIVIRPHPIELEDAWEKLIGEYPNVYVIKKGGVSAWIRHCSLLINNGCTTAFEAAAINVPRIAYRPFESDYEYEMPNKVCHSISSLDMMKDYIIQILSDNFDNEDLNKATNKILHSRFANLKGKLAADKIVDEWESIDHPSLIEQSTVNELIKIKEDYLKNEKKTNLKFKKYLAKVKNKIIQKDIGNVKNVKKEKLLHNPHKFIDLKDKEVTGLLSRLRYSLNRFQEVKVQRFGEKSFIVYSENHKN